MLHLPGASVLQFDAFHSVSEGLLERSKANGNAMDAYEQGMRRGLVQEWDSLTIHSSALVHPEFRKTSEEWQQTLY